MANLGQSQIALFAPYQQIAYTSIMSSYVAIGSPFLHMMRLIAISNTTDGDMIVSTDGSTNMLFIPAGTFKLYDISTNRETACNFFLPYGTQFYVKYSSAPSKGSVTVEGIYGQGE